MAIAAGATEERDDFLGDYFANHTELEELYAADLLDAAAGHQATFSAALHSLLSSAQRSAWHAETENAWDLARSTANTAIDDHQSASLAALHEFDLAVAALADQALGLEAQEEWDLALAAANAASAQAIAEDSALVYYSATVTPAAHASALAQIAAETQYAADSNTASTDATDAGWPRLLVNLWVYKR